MKASTITAISTPIGVGGISIIRMSGDKSLDIAKRVFSPLKKGKELHPRELVLGVVDTGDIKEKCLCVYFKAPYSYTGEDLVEFHCHGGVVIANAVLNLLLKSGASLAEAGEFTKRAFVNGKLTLDEAEGVMDMISAESESEVRAGYSLMNGELSKTVREIQKSITDTLARIEVVLDYPEHDIEEQTTLSIKNEFEGIQDRLDKLYNTTSTGRLIKNGVRVSLVGKPNAGKSSIMNAMLNFDRAIVTNVKGTTRDTIEECYIFDGVKFVLIDTAGIRKSDDIVEKIGIDKSLDTIKQSDINVLVLDNAEGVTDEDLELYNLVKDKKHIVVVNKSELDYSIDLSQIESGVIYLSAKNLKNIDTLKQKIYDTMIDSGVLGSGLVITSQRHKEILGRAIEKTREVITALELNNSLDLVSIDISELWQTLGEITGDNDNEAVIDSIFKNFCVGK